MSEAFYTELKANEHLKLMEQAKRAIATAVTASAATCTVPIPTADAPVLLGEQVALMGTIFEIYGVKADKEVLKKLVLAVLGSGTIKGAAISSGIAEIITSVLGEAAIHVCCMVRSGKLSESELATEKGVDILKSEFETQFKQECPDK